MRNGTEVGTVLSENLRRHSIRLNVELDRRMHGPIAPNEEIVFNVWKFRKEREFIALAIASWWLGNVGFLVREVLKEKKLSNKETELRLRLVLGSKYLALEVLKDQFSERDFFGNLLPLIVNCCERMTIVSNRQRPAKRTIRRRGYRDHGTLRPKDKWSEKNDWSFTEQQLLLEEIRQSEEDTYQFLRGLLGEL